MIGYFCKICGKVFNSYDKTRVTCSIKCRSKLQHLNMKNKLPKNIQIFTEMGEATQYKKGRLSNSKLSIDKDILYNLYINQSKTIREISSMLDVCDATINNYLVEYQIQRRNQGFQKENKVQSYEKHWNWKGGISSLNNQIRSSQQMILWRNSVFKRDHYTCTTCRYNSNLHAHHIIEFHKIIEKYNIETIDKAKNCVILWDINNGTTLCNQCHLNVHKKDRNLYIQEGEKDV